MDLTALERDLLGDMAEDHHSAREIVGFVRLHHGDDPSTVRRTLRWLLATWYERGWLAVADRPPDYSGSQAADIPELVMLLDRADLLTPGWEGAETWLRLTDRAHFDQPWRRLPANESLQLTGAFRMRAARAIVGRPCT